MAPKRRKGADVASGEKAAADAAMPTDSGRSSLAEFEAWMTKAHITWDTSLIQLRAGGASSSDDITTAGHDAAAPKDPKQAADAPWAVYAVAPVPEGAVLASIPRCAVLSAASCGLSDVLAAERLGGGLALVAGVMYEAARGKQSKWYGYLSSLPPREYLPVFWSEEQLRRLEGSDLAHKARADRAAMASDFRSELAPLLSRYPARLGPLAHGWNLRAFMRAASWVASRAFYVDERHGDALVPLADVFNHKAARVDLRGGGSWAEGFVVAEQADAAHRQGRDGGGKRRRRQQEGGEEEGEGGSGCSDDEEQGGEGDGSEEEEEEEESEEAPVLSHEELDRHPGEDGEQPWPPAPPPPPPPPTPPPSSRETEGSEGCSSSRRGPRGRWGLLAAQQAAGAAAAGAAAAAVSDGSSGGGGGSGVRLNLHLDIGICAVERGGCEVLDIVAAQPLSRGAEVFNTYGEHGNSELVNKYGFALPYNPFDELLLDKAAVVAAAEALFGRQVARRGARFLEKHSELLSEGEEPFLLLPPRHVNTPLFLALRVLGAEAGEVQGWRDMQDVVAPLREAWQREKEREQGREDQQEQQDGAGEGEGGGGKRKREGREQGGEEEEEKDGGEGARVEQGGSGRTAASSSQPAAKRAKRGSAGAATAAAAADVDADANMKAEGESEEEEEEEEDDLPEDVEIEAPPAQPPTATAGREPEVLNGGQAGGQQQHQQHQSKKSSTASKLSQFKARAAATAKAAAAAAAAAAASGAKRSDGSTRADEGAHAGDLQPPKAEQQALAAAAAEQQTAPSMEPSLWTPRMRALLQRVVSERLAAYPTSLEQDEQELQRGFVAGSGGADGGGGKGKGTSKGKGKGKSKVDEAAAACSAAEAEAAWRCALRLRVGEKRLLRAVMERLGA